MMVEEINNSVKKNRSWAVLGVAIGLILIVGYFGYEVVMTPNRPGIPTAPAREIVAYVNNPRGLAKLADIEQRQFLEEWREHLSSDESAKAALKADLESIGGDERKQFVEVMLQQFKRIIVSDARQYDQMSTEERHRFVQKKAAEFEGQEAFMKQLATVLSSTSWSEDKLRSWTFDNTTPAEREICMPYLESLQRAAEALRKQRRAEPVAARP